MDVSDPNYRSPGVKSGRAGALETQDERDSTRHGGGVSVTGLNAWAQPGMRGRR